MQLRYNEESHLSQDKTRRREEREEEAYEGKSQLLSHACVGSYERVIDGAREIESDRKRRAGWNGRAGGRLV